jgi:hypothetical protein
MAQDKSSGEILAMSYIHVHWMWILQYCNGYNNLLHLRIV